MRPEPSIHRHFFVRVLPNGAFHNCDKSFVPKLLFGADDYRLALRYSCGLTLSTSANLLRPSTMSTEGQGWSAGLCWRILLFTLDLLRINIQHHVQECLMLSARASAAAAAAVKANLKMQHPPNLSTWPLEHSNLCCAIKTTPKALIRLRMRLRDTLCFV